MRIPFLCCSSWPAMRPIRCINSCLITINRYWAALSVQQKYLSAAIRCSSRITAKPTGHGHCSIPKTKYDAMKRYSPKNAVQFLKRALSWQNNILIFFVAVLSAIRTAIGAFGKETFGRTSLLADTRLCARLSLRDTPGDLYHYTFVISTSRFPRD